MLRGSGAPTAGQKGPSLTPIHSHHHDHIRRQKHAENLQVLHEATHQIRPHESFCHVPHKLRAHLEEGDHQIRQARVKDEDAPSAEDAQQRAVEDGGSGEDEPEQRDLHFSQNLISYHFHRNITAVEQAHCVFVRAL